MKEIFRYRSMIANLIKRDLRGRYKASVLGFLWTFLNPLFQILIYSFVFSIILNSNIEKYYLHLCVVLIPWVFFSTALTSGANVIVGNSTLIKKIYFPRVVLPLAYVTSSFINMLFSFIIIFLIIFFSRVPISLVAVIWLPFIMFIEYIFVLGVTLLSSSITVYFRDMQQILNLLNMAWMYLTPVVYSESIIPNRFRWIIYINPMTPISIAYRNILYYAKIPNIPLLLLAALESGVVLLFSLTIFQRLERKFAEEL